MCNSCVEFSWMVFKGALKILDTVLQSIYNRTVDSDQLIISKELKKSFAKNEHQIITQNKTRNQEFVL